MDILKEEGATLRIRQISGYESRHTVVQTPHDIRLHPTRWKPLLAALIFAGVVVGAFLVYGVWTPPTLSWHPWQYQQPAVTILFLCVGLLFAAPVPVGLYWTFTSQPMLHLTPSSLAYHPFPYITRTIQWRDVNHITAFTTTRMYGFGLHRITSLTISFILKPDHVSAYGGKQQIKMDIGLGGISLSADELLALIGQCIAEQ